MVHTRATNSILFDLDPEIERTFLQQLRQSVQNIVIESTMANQPQPPTLRQLTDPDLTQHNLGVTFPVVDEWIHFEWKTGFINLLPKFHGLSGEDPIMHISEFNDIDRKSVV